MGPLQKSGVRATTDDGPGRHAVGKNLAARIDIAPTTAIIVAIC
jgi:hypothetical protein